MSDEIGRTPEAVEAEDTAAMERLAGGPGEEDEQKTSRLPIQPSPTPVVIEDDEETD